MEKEKFLQNQMQQPSNKSSKPSIAGILLIVAGMLALVTWIGIITIDDSMIESIIDISNLQQIDPTITPEKVKDLLVVCGTIGCILSIFPILAGILALKRKLWGIALAGSIIGLFTMGILFTSSILSLIALILIIMSKKEFLIKPS